MKNSNSVDRIIQIDDVNIGKNIAKQWKSMHIKQTDMVARLQLLDIEISIYSYNRIEKRTQNPTVSLLLGCCEILECDMNLLFDYQKQNTISCFSLDSFPCILYNSYTVLSIRWRLALDRGRKTSGGRLVCADRSEA